MFWTFSTSFHTISLVWASSVSPTSKKSRLRSKSLARAWEVSRKCTLVSPIPIRVRYSNIRPQKGHTWTNQSEAATSFQWSLPEALSTASAARQPDHFCDIDARRRATNTWEKAPNTIELCLDLEMLEKSDLYASFIYFYWIHVVHNLKLIPHVVYTVYSIIYHVLFDLTDLTRFIWQYPIAPKPIDLFYWSCRFNSLLPTLLLLGSAIKLLSRLWLFFPKIKYFQVWAFVCEPARAKTNLV